MKRPREGSPLDVALAVAVVAVVVGCGYLWVWSAVLRITRRGSYARPPR